MTKTPFILLPDPLFLSNEVRGRDVGEIRGLRGLIFQYKAVVE